MFLFNLNVTHENRAFGHEKCTFEERCDSDMFSKHDQYNYVLQKAILKMQRMHPRTETRVCKFSGPD